MPHITFPARMLETVTALTFLRDHLGSGRASIRGFMELATEELLLNIVQYAYVPDCGEEGRVELGLRETWFDGEAYVCVWLRDWGAPYNPFSRALAGAAGEGTATAAHVSAHQMYSSSDGANTVELYFRDPLSCAAFGADGPRG